MRHGNVGGAIVLAVAGGIFPERNLKLPVQGTIDALDRGCSGISLLENLTNPFRRRSGFLIRSTRCMGSRLPTSADSVLPITVQHIRLAAGIKVAAQRTRWHHDPSLLSANEFAAKIGIPVNWLYVQIRKKRLLIDRQPSGTYLLPDTPSVLDAVCSLRNHNISSLDLRINQPDKEGHQHE